MKKRVSLKAKILLIFGSLLILLMLVVSLSVLYRWRKLILSSQMQSAEAIAQSFSFSVIDALIYQQNDLLNSDEYLESYLLDFSHKNRQIRFIAIYDDRGGLLAHSDLSELSVPSRKPAALSPKFKTRIYHNPRWGWLIETHFPLQTGEKKWGLLSMAFNAAPARQAIRRIFLLLFILTVIGVLIILAVMYVFSNRLTRSLRLLVKEMDKVDLRRASATVLAESNDEIGFLVRHFNDMKARLTASREQLIEAQKQIYQAEKLASVGRLASGVAHEINNPLNGVKNCLYAIRREPENLAQTRSYLELMDEGLNHIETIVRKLLSFSRQSTTHPHLVSLNKEIDLVLSLLQYRLDQQHIQILRTFRTDLPQIMADSHLLQEVLMNLLLNSFDALGKNGKIIIETGLQDSQTVYCRIADNGPGIAAVHQRKIFEPFFTTKEEGKGTGLGLSVSLGIVEAHGGTLTVESKPGHTCFTILLPLRFTSGEKNENIIN